MWPTGCGLLTSALHHNLFTRPLILREQEVLGWLCRGPQGPGALGGRGSEVSFLGNLTLGLSQEVLGETGQPRPWFLLGRL